MTSKMTAKGQVTIYLFISNILRKFHSDRLNGSEDTLC